MAATPSPNELFTAVNITGVGIATAAVNVVTNALYKLAKLPPKWTAFIASLVIAYIVAFLHTAPAWYDWVLAFFNACLLFCSALGINELGVAAVDGGQARGFARRAPLIPSWVRSEARGSNLARPAAPGSPADAGVPAHAGAEEE